MNISRDKRARIFSLKSMFIDPSGRLVNYHQLRLNPIYQNLSELSRHLISINLDNITENERKTFFISKIYLLLAFKPFRLFQIFTIY